MHLNLVELIQQEKWEIKGSGKDARIIAFDQEFPFTHPVQIHLKRYREEKIPDLKFYHMKAAHDYLWPQMIPTWNYWDERRFRAHCEGWKYISYAGGASTGKSDCAARIVDLYFLADPLKRTILVASTTLDSLNRRIFGYCIRYLSEMAVPLTYRYFRGNSPHVLYDSSQMQHGIFAVSAKQGDDEKTISTWIGRKAKGGFMLVLDEGTDMPLALMGAFPNLEQAAPEFQCTIIGNSNSRYDLHGSMSSPKDGFESIDPKESIKWETTQDKGLCLYFNAYESPAIHETDLVKKKLLSKVFITKEALTEKEGVYGKDSDAFYRFVLGFWKSSSTENMMMTKEFMAPRKLYEKAHWLGVDPLICVGGLDPAFSSGGDKCILRLAYLGQTIDGDIVLDFRGQDLLFDINISATSGESAEIQISQQVTAILNKYGCALHNLVIDASGQGRALGGTLQLYAKSVRPPLKIYNVRTGNQKDKSFDVIPKTRHELWFDVRKFVESGNVRGIDSVALNQLSSRLIIRNEKTGKQELESKGDYKKRMGAVMPSMAHSPDEADALSLCLQSAIINFGFFPGQRREVPKVAPGALQEIAMWKQNVKTFQENHLKGEVQGYPTVDFKGVGFKPWGSL